MPFVPQLEAGLATQVFDGSGAPAATSPQRPIALGSAQDLHAPAQAVEQQTPCAQKPEPHSVGSEQNEPLVFFPHELALQTFGGTQAAAPSVHTPKQRAPLHAYGAQGSDEGAAHWPVLLHVAAGV